MGLNQLLELWSNLTLTSSGGIEQAPAHKLAGQKASLHSIVQQPQDVLLTANSNRGAGKGRQLATLRKLDREDMPETVSTRCGYLTWSIVDAAARSEVERARTGVKVGEAGLVGRQEGLAGKCVLNSEALAQLARAARQQGVPRPHGRTDGGGSAIQATATAVALSDVAGVAGVVDLQEERGLSVLMQRPTRAAACSKATRA